MTIIDRNEMEDRKIEIDLSGPDGNAFVLFGLAKSLHKQISNGDQLRPIDDILEDMQSSDYDHLIEVFDNEFGDFVIMYR